MLGLTVNVAKGSFFDRQKVQDAADKATRKVLSRFGAYTRQRARTSLRYRKASSVPGMPPTVHRTMTRTKTNKKTGVAKKQTVSPLREFVFFAFDASRKTVVIGPALLNGKGGPMILRAIEYGGPTVIKTRGKRKRVMVRARPFMRPAFEEEKKSLPDMWKNSVR